MKGTTMPKTRKSYPPSLKAKVAVEAIRSQKTVAELGQFYSVNPNLVTKWKRQAVEGLPEIFRSSGNGIGSSAEAEKDELFKQIGQLKVELEWLKKRSGLVG